MGKIMLKITGILALIICIGLGYYFHTSKNLTVSSIKFNKKKRYYNSKHFSIVTNLGTLYQARMELAIPCKDKEQYSEITQNMTKIKNALLTTLDPNKMTQLIDKRDFEEIKKTYLYIINDFVSKPVDTIYIESFNY